VVIQLLHPVAGPCNHRVARDRTRRRNLCEIPQIVSLSKLSDSAASCILSRLFILRGNFNKEVTNRD
jgi:hypothetical protein